MDRNAAWVKTAAPSPWWILSRRVVAMAYRLATGCKLTSIGVRCHHSCRVVWPRGKLQGHRHKIPFELVLIAVAVYVTIVIVTTADGELAASSKKKAKPANAAWVWASLQHAWTLDRAQDHYVRVIYGGKYVKQVQGTHYPGRAETASFTLFVVWMRSASLPASADGMWMRSERSLLDLHVAYACRLDAWGLTVAFFKTELTNNKV